MNITDFLLKVVFVFSVLIIVAAAYSAYVEWRMIKQYNEYAVTAGEPLRYFVFALYNTQLFAIAFIGVYLKYYT